MTSTTTTTAAADGGTTAETSTPDSPAQPVRGLARLRDDECYYVTGLVISALGETERLIRRVHDKAQDRYLNHRQGDSEPLDAEEITRLLGEAYQCSLMASTYIDRAAMRWLDSDAETPF